MIITQWLVVGLVLFGLLSNLIVLILRKLDEKDKKQGVGGASALEAAVALNDVMEEVDDDDDGPSPSSVGLAARARYAGGGVVSAVKDRFNGQAAAAAAGRSSQVVVVTASTNEDDYVEDDRDGQMDDDDDVDDRRSPVRVRQMSN